MKEGIKKVKGKFPNEKNNFLHAFPPKTENQPSGGKWFFSISFPRFQTKPNLNQVYHGMKQRKIITKITAKAERRTADKAFL